MKYLFFILCLIPLFSEGQSTSIGGTINIYTPVIAISTTACPNKVLVEDASGFIVGDRVLIIQMKGAMFDTSNTASFGNLLGLGGAGNYEISQVSSVNGNLIGLNGNLFNTYIISGNVQLIRIPYYTNAMLSSQLSCQPWNGKTGGVLILEVQNNLTLNFDIDVSGKGFRGGKISKNPDGSCGLPSLLYHYPLYQPGSFWNEGGAQKGEGICDIDTPRIAGRGPMVNGGGGGNKHNNGAGGGSNYTAGGMGGNALAFGCVDAPGIGGISLAGFYAGSKLFAGGGGGRGDDNNTVGSKGESGGGIAIIIAGTITGNNSKIKANGNSVTVIGGAAADGAGGGGGGGAVFLKTNSITSATVEANGGDGGKQTPLSFCVGPGGGGGSGVILTNLASLSSITTSMLPGAAGIIFNTSLNCDNTTYGATPGANTPTGVLTGKTLLYTPDCAVYTALKQEAELNETLLLYPDPACSFISWSESPGRNIRHIQIMDYSGKIVYESLRPDLPQQIGIERLANGVYFIEITYRTGTARGKFIKLEN